VNLTIFQIKRGQNIKAQRFVDLKWLTENLRGASQGK